MFKKYSSIENSYQTKVVKSIRDEGYDTKCDWLVFEKIDGSNFCIICNTNGEIKCARRNAVLKEDESFFNYSVVCQKYEEQVRILFDRLKELYPEIVCVNVFGELYGGNYPGIAKLSGSINNNVFYNPEIDFIVFDVYINMGENGERWLDYDEYSKLVEGIPYLQPLFRGTFDEALEYDPKFVTTIPDILGLPKIEENFAEGVVIKPSQTVFLRTGSRVVLKNKIEKYSERKIRVRSETAGESHRVEEYINKNRLHNVVSKLGETKHFPTLMKEFSLDIIADYEKDNFVADDKERKLIRKVISKFACSLVNEYIQTDTDACS